MTMAELAEEMTADYMDNLAAMGIDTIDHFPRATATMDDIIKITQTLVDKGFAYAADGDVYFDVARCGLRQAEQSFDRVDAWRRRRDGGAEARRPRTLPCGKAPSPASPPGTAPGEKGEPAGISNARP